MKGLLFTYGLAYGGGVIALFNPFFGLLVYVCFAIIRPQSLWYWSVPAENYSRVIGIALLIGWAANGFGNWRLGRSRAIVIAFLGFFALMIISACFAPDQQLAWRYVEEFAKIVLPFLVGITTINTVHRLHTLAWVIVASEGYLAFEMNMSYLGGFNRVREVGHGSLDNNGIAITMVAATGLAFFLGLYETRLRRWLAFLAAALMAHVVLLSDSRGGMLALIVTAAVAFFSIERKMSHYFSFAVAVLIGFWLTGPSVVARFSTVFAESENRDSSAQSRFDLSRTCLQMMGDEPLVGVGPGHFRLFSENYGWPKGKDGHTTWLQVGAEMGVLAMFAQLAFYLLTLKRCWSLMRSKTPELAPLGDVGRMVVASLVGYMVAAQFVTMYGVELSYYIALLGAAAVKLESEVSDFETFEDESGGMCC